MRKIFSGLFVLAIVFTACAPTRVVTLTASNTGIPVLLSPSDSSGPTSGRKCSAANITENNKINITLGRTMAMTTDSRNTTEKHYQSEATIVDLVILKKTLNDKNTNICIDAVETSDFGIYLVFGLLEKTTVSMNSHIEKVEKGNSLNQTKVEAQK